MKKHGVFISYRHADWALAGRVYDFLKAKGLEPFWDSTSMQPGPFSETLRQQVEQAPCFLCILTKNTFKNFIPGSPFCKEIETALSCPNKQILLIADDSFRGWPMLLPKSIVDIKKNHFYDLNRGTFIDVMERICQKINWENLAGVLDWKQRIRSSNNVFLAKREYIEKTLAPLADRFGVDLLKSILNNQEYDGENPVRFIHMSCYAASVIFSHEQTLMDERAYDFGTMFNVFAWLLRDPNFNLEIVINAPGGIAMRDAIEQEKLGNSALEKTPEAVFLSSYYNIQQLINGDSIFAEAYKEKRFRFMVTENVLPYALFQVEYKPGYEAYDHIKVDLYSEGIVSNMERRCMMIFKQDDLENYSFFANRYAYIRKVTESDRLIQKHHAQWIEQWEQMR